MGKSEMHELPEELRYLGRAKRERLQNIRVKERQDAALNVVFMGLKALNQVHGIGLDRQSKLCRVWERAIMDYYKTGASRWKEETGFPADGKAELHVLKVNDFSDLSDRARRKVAEWLAAERLAAADIAAGAGMEAIRQQLSLGEKRMGEVLQQWKQDIRDFYDDRERCEPQLKAWLEEIGFCVEGGKVRCYMGGDGKAIRKRTAEKRLEEQEKEKEI